MILVRMTFQAKMGCANQVVAGFKQGMDVMRDASKTVLRARILTDLSGPFDTVIQELEFASMADVMQGMANLFSDPRWQKMQEEGEASGLITGGSKEYYTVEYEG